MFLLQVPGYTACVLKFSNVGKIKAFNEKGQLDYSNAGEVAAQEMNSVSPNSQQKHFFLQSI